MSPSSSRERHAHACFRADTSTARQAQQGAPARSLAGAAARMAVRRTGRAAAAHQNHQGGPPMAEHLAAGGHRIAGGPPMGLRGVEAHQAHPMAAVLLCVSYCTRDSVSRDVSTVHAVNSKMRARRREDLEAAAGRQADHSPEVVEVGPMAALSAKRHVSPSCVCVFLSVCVSSCVSACVSSCECACMYSGPEQTTDQKNSCCACILPPPGGPPRPPMGAGAPLRRTWRVLPSTKEPDRMPVSC